MKIDASHPLASELCEALGLDPEMVRAFTLRLDAFEPAYVEVQMYLDEGRGRVLVTALRRYELHAREVEALEGG